MRRWLMAIGLTVATTLGASGVAGATPHGHFQVGQQWTVEITTSANGDGNCAIETVGPGGTLTFDNEALQNGHYRAGGRNASESFSDPLGSWKFHGTWSATLVQYTGRWRAKGGIAGRFSGQVVPGAVPSWGDSTC